MSTIRKLLALLDANDRRRSLLLLGMVVIMALLDMIGVASILPFMTVLADPGMVTNNRYLATIYQNLGFSSPKNFLALLGLTVFLLMLLSTVFKAVTTYSLLRFSQMQEYVIGRRLVAGYLRQPYEWFLSHHSAEIGKTVLSEVGQVTNGSFVPMMQLIAQAAVVAAIIGLLVFVNPIIACLMIFGLGAVYSIIYLSLRRYLTRIGAGRIVSNRLRFKVIQETFGGFKDVKIGGLERTALERFEGPAKNYAHHQTASLVVAHLPRYALEIVALAGMLLLAIYATRSPGGLTTTLPLIALYGLAGLRLLPALQQGYAHLTRIRFSEPGLDRLHADITALSTIDGFIVADSREQSITLKRELALDCVTYKYPGSANSALKELCLRIPVHAVVGLVGTSGSGKTTALDIMLGLLTPQSGQLLVDGNPVTQDNLRAWRRTVGYVPQQVFLTDDTVAGNIAFGIPHNKINAAAVEHAARIANLHDFVTDQLPRGYQTQIGEHGVRLSGGERQRIGIARALYHDPEILFLDEATSALDNLTEQVVMDAVYNLGRKKTIVLIAHRLSTVRACDTVFVLEDGELLAKGTYAELLFESGRFKAMATLTK